MQCIKLNIFVGFNRPGWTQAWGDWAPPINQMRGYSHGCKKQSASNTGASHHLINTICRFINI